MPYKGLHRCVHYKHKQGEVPGRIRGSIRENNLGTHNGCLRAATRSSTKTIRLLAELARPTISCYITILGESGKKEKEDKHLQPLVLFVWSGNSKNRQRPHISLVLETMSAKGKPDLIMFYVQPNFANNSQLGKDIRCLDENLRLCVFPLR